MFGMVYAPEYTRPCRIVGMPGPAVEA